MLLMEVYNKAGLKPDVTNKARLLGLLRSFPADEPTRKRFGGEVIGYVIIDGGREGPRSSGGFRRIRIRTEVGQSGALH